MAKLITALALLLAAVSFLFLAPGPKHVPDSDNTGDAVISTSKDSGSNDSSKIDKILEEKRVPADEVPDETDSEETSSEADE